MAEINKSKKYLQNIWSNKYSQKEYNKKKKNKFEKKNEVQSNNNYLFQY